MACRHSQSPTPRRPAVASPPWWRFGMVWFVFSGPALVVVAGFATMAIAFIGADAEIHAPTRGRGVLDPDRRARTACRSARPRTASMPRRSSAQRRRAENDSVKHRVLQILWPAFLVAGVMEILLFAAFDPAEIRWFGGLLGWQPVAVYSVVFLVLWAARRHRRRADRAAAPHRRGARPAQGQPAAVLRWTRRSPPRRCSWASPAACTAPRCAVRHSVRSRRAPAAGRLSRATMSVHAGRLLSYAAAGALVASSVSALGTLQTAGPILRPIWTLGPRRGHRLRTLARLAGADAALAGARRPLAGGCLAGSRRPRVHDACRHRGAPAALGTVLGRDSVRAAAIGAARRRARSGAGAGRRRDGDLRARVRLRPVGRTLSVVAARHRARRRALDAAQPRAWPARCSPRRPGSRSGTAWAPSSRRSAACRAERATGGRHRAALAIETARGRERGDHVVAWTTVAMTGTFSPGASSAAAKKTTIAQTRASRWQVVAECIEFHRLVPWSCPRLASGRCRNCAARRRDGSRARRRRRGARGALGRRTTSTGTGLLRTTSSALVAATARSTPIRPCVPMTIRSQPPLEAASTIALAGVPRPSSRTSVSAATPCWTARSRASPSRCSARVRSDRRWPSKSAGCDISNASGSAQVTCSSRRVEPHGTARRSASVRP